MNGIQALHERQEQELANLLLTFLSARPQDRVTALRWDELGEIQKALSPYTPQTLRFYTHLCDDMGLLKNFCDDGEVFSMEGISSLGKLQRSQKRTLHQDSVGFWLVYFILCVCLAVVIAMLKGTGIV